MRRALVLIAAIVGAGCRDLDAPAESTSLDPSFFRCEVEPVLIKSCGQLACHGDTKRFFRVFGRNRLRYGLPPEKRNEPVLDGEHDHNFEGAAAFVDLEAPESSLLVSKPLDVRGGGRFHGGALEYGQGDVFLSKEEANYQALLSWAKGAKADPNCHAPGDEGTGGAP